jgi:hypothetical protein
LGREISETGRDAKEEGVVLFKGGDVDGWVGGFWTSMELGEDFF